MTEYHNTLPVPHLPRLILVHGLKESGKSTLADHFCGSYGYERVKMAGPLKNMLRSLMRDAGIAEEMIEPYVEGDMKGVPIPQLSGRTSRYLMQTLGDEWRKMQAEDFWIDIAVGKIDQIIAAGGSVVVDDLRYVNEFCRFAVYRPLTFVVTRGDGHFAPVEATRHPGERGLPVGLFHSHIANDFETKTPYWALADNILRNFSDFAAAQMRFGVHRDVTPTVVAAAERLAA